MMSVHPQADIPISAISKNEQINIIPRRIFFTFTTLSFVGCIFQFYRKPSKCCLQNVLEKP
jgi:hypothetical protein